MNSAIVDNITLAALPKFAVTPLEFIERDRMRLAAREVAEALQHQGKLARGARRGAFRAATSRRSCSPNG